MPVPTGLLRPIITPDDDTVTPETFAHKLMAIVEHS